MSASSAIVLGVVSGVLATVVTALAIQFFRKIFLPWYQTVTYQGQIVGGEWEVRSDGIQQTAQLKLEQNAHHLQGECVFIGDGAGAAYELSRACIVEGTIHDRIVRLTYRHKDRGRLGAGVFLFEVTGDGRLMEGALVMYGVIAGTITHQEATAGRLGVMHTGKIRRRVFLDRAALHPSLDVFEGTGVKEEFKVNDRDSERKKDR